MIRYIKERDNQTLLPHQTGVNDERVCYRRFSAKRDHSVVAAAVHQTGTTNAWAIEVMSFEQVKAVMDAAGVKNWTYS